MKRKLNSVAIVERFWNAVWKARNPNAVADFVVDDFVIISGGVQVVGKENFIDWIRGFLEKINDFNFEVIETFQNEDGSRVTSLWRVTGKNNGMLNTAPSQQPISFTGIAVWSVREDGKFIQNRVERASWEVFQSLQS